MVITWGDRLKPPHKSTPVKLQIILPANASPPYMAGHTRTTHTQTSVSRYYDFIIKDEICKICMFSTSRTGDLWKKYICFQHGNQNIKDKDLEVQSMVFQHQNQEIKDKRSMEYYVYMFSQHQNQNIKDERSMKHLRTHVFFNIKDKDLRRSILLPMA